MRTLPNPPGLGRLLSLFVFLLLATFGRLLAQNTQLYIDGPFLVCTGQCDTFTAVGFAPVPYPAGAYSFLWSTGSTTPSITLCFDLPGSTNISVTVTNQDGLSATATHQILVLPYVPLEILSGNTTLCNADSLVSSDQLCEKVCPNTTVTYYLNNNSPGGLNNPVTWAVFGASSYTVSPQNNAVTVTWGGPGPGSVKVSAASSTGCAGAANYCVTIVEEPEAKFTADPAPPATGPLQICRGQTVYFENQSQNAEQYEWYFNDDQTNPAETDPVHLFASPGLYTVRLIARSACFCADTTELTVEVLDALSPTLDCVGTICPGATVTYTQDGVCDDVQWTVSPNGAVLAGGTAGSDSVTVQWNAGPVGIITLLAQTCPGGVCPFPAVVRVPIIDDNAEIRGPEQVCPGDRTVYDIEPYGGAGFVWALSGGGYILEGQGTSGVSIQWIDFANPNAVYWLTVEYDNCYLGCGGRDSIAVRVVSPFVITGPVEQCANSAANFTARLTSNLQALPADWTLYAPNGLVVWSSASASATVTVPFAQGSGFYRLIALPADPTQTCTQQAEWAIQVPTSPAPPLSISGPAIICPGSPVTYEALGLSAGANLRWTYQNGPGVPTTATGNPLNVTWGASPPYWIAAAQVSSDGLGCLSDTVQLAITGPGALAVTGPTMVCEDASAVYNLPPLNGLGVQWSIQPAQAGTVVMGQGTEGVEIFWYDPGTYILRATVCAQSLDYSVTVLPKPAPVVQGPGGVCAGQTALIQTTVPFSAYTWSLAAGGVVGNGPSVTLGAGYYSVEVINSAGCRSTATFNLVTYPDPNVSLTTTDPTFSCPTPSPVFLQALTTQGDPYTYSWFLDGLPLGATGATYTATQYGAYTVVATNASGCTGLAGPILLQQDCAGGGGSLPSQGTPCPAGSVAIGIVPTGACDSLGFQVVAGPTYVSGSANWLFFISGGAVLGGGGGDVTAFNFPNAGQYLVYMTAQLTTGATCFLLDSVAITAAAAFTADPACPGSSTGFVDETSLLPGAAIVGWSWNFGDPPSGGANTSALTDPGHAYSNGGAYTVALTVTAQSGCTSVATAAISVPIAPTATFATPAAVCSGNANIFTTIPPPGTIALDWSFGDPSSGPANSAAGTPVYHTYSTPGSYSITLQATNAYGCTAAFVQPLTIAPNSLSGAITPANPAPFCEGQTLVLQAPLLAGVSYLWSDNSSASTLTVGAEDTYSVTITDGSGCTYVPPPVAVEVTPDPDGIIKAALINDLGQIIGLQYPTLGACAGEPVTLIVQGSGGYSYSWSTGSSGTQIEFSEDHNNLLGVGTHIFTVTVTQTSTGCTSVTAPFIVDIHPVPGNISISGNGFCAGSSTTLQYMGPPPPANWQLIWNNGATGLGLTTTEPGIYSVRAINEFGCAATSNALTILPGPNIGAVPSGCHTRCNPDTLCLPVLPDVVSWQWFFNGSPIPGATQPGFVAQQSGSYYALLTDVFGCTATSDPLDLELYPGFGHIYGRVWSDVNSNGVIDAADTLVSGIPVDLWQGGAPWSNTSSGPGGDFAFTNIPSAGYMVQLNPSLLPPGWQVIIGQVPATLSGCDVQTSADLLLHYFICPPISTNVALSACDGGSADYNGMAIPAGASETFVFQNADGCDSIVNVTVAVLPVDYEMIDLAACAGTTVFYNGTAILAGTSALFNYQNTVGCDSLIEVAVSVYPVTPPTAFEAFICPGEVYFYNGNILAPGETADFLLSNQWGCDSVVTVTVQTWPAAQSSLAVGVCPGDSYTYNGQSWPAGTTQAFHFTNWQGCDSVVALTVQALPPSQSSLEAAVCPGDFYTYHGQPWPAGTTQTFVLDNWQGCDSTVTLTVQTLSASSGVLNTSVCPGDTYSFQGVNLVAGEVRDFTLQNVAGCDSILTVTVTALPVSTTPLDVVVCPGETYTYQGVELLPGETRDFHFIGQEGCDSTVTITVSAFPAVVFAVAAENSCPNQPTGQVEVTITAGSSAPYRYALDAGAFGSEPIFADLAAGNYTVFIEDANGCVFEAPALVEAPAALQVALANGILPCDSGGVVLRPVLSGDTTGLSFQWSTGATSPSVLVTEVGSIAVVVQNTCETVQQEATVAWADLIGDPTFAYVPNTIAPEAREQQNSIFKPYFPAGLDIQDYLLEVYDRWGNLMFRTENIEDGWTGPFREQVMDPAVFVWYFTARVGFCGRVLDLKRKGDVTVVR